MTDLMFTGNTWVWFHMLGGGILALLFYYFYNKVSHTKIPARLSFFTVGGVAVLWELIEKFMGGADAYASTKDFFFDSVGDIFGALAIALMVLWITLRKEEKNI